MGKEIDVHIDSVQEKSDRFRKCVGFLGQEEEETNDAEIIAAWKLILRKLLNEILSTLRSLKEDIAWSLLGDRRSSFLKISSELTPTLALYKEYEDEDTRKKANEVMLLLDEGRNGFRQSYIQGDYYEQLFHKELKDYESENRAHQETLYTQDCEDHIFEYPDETMRKNHMVAIRRKALFESTRFGKAYHDKERKITPFTAYILEQNEQDYTDIYDFLGKYLAHEIAKEHLAIKHETVFKNHIFKDNVDVDKVINKLKEFVKDETIGAQKHWFIVYKVFLSKKWLKRNTQKRFIDFMDSVFHPILKCTSSDFKKIEGYFKKTDYAEWSLDNAKAPSCCDTYKKIADILDREFTESRYAKPGMMINTIRREKFR